ncbi:MAG TPA: hypothetical protein PKY81_08345, partial [bacterium]|nr:hypothetical protein [bacterium]
LTEEYKTNLTDEKLQNYIEKNITQYNPAKKIIKVKIIRETEKKPELLFELDNEAMENERKTFGKTILFSSDDSLEPSEIIKLYHGKNKIDELHKILKCPSGVMFHPNWVWTDSKLMVQAFVNIMALTILKLIEKKFKDSKSEYSANAVLLKEMLESIQLVLVLEDLTVSRKAVNKFTMPAQQHLFTIFNMERFLK